MCAGWRKLNALLNRDGLNSIFVDKPMRTRSKPVRTSRLPSINISPSNGALSVKMFTNGLSWTCSQSSLSLRKASLGATMVNGPCVRLLITIIPSRSFGACLLLASTRRIQHSAISTRVLADAE